MSPLVLVALLLTALPVSSRAEKPPLVITTTLEARRELVPDLYILPVSIAIRRPKEQGVLSALGRIDEAVRALGLDYRGGSYALTKNCRWDGKRRVCKGYRGWVRYAFRLKEVEKQDVVLELLTGLKDRLDQEVDISVESPRWEVSPQREQAVREELQLELIRRARRFGQKLSKELGEDCCPVEIDFSATLSPIRAFMRAKLEAGIEAPQPRRAPQVITLRARVKYRCP